MFVANKMFILGKKAQMTQVWKDSKVVPVTVVKAEPNSVTLVRTKERDGYTAVQVAAGKKKREFRGVIASARRSLSEGGNNAGNNANIENMNVGDKIDVSAFAEGDMVRVSGTSKGRGFQGVVKRHGFHGGPKTHGQKNRLRAPGSIGSTAPQRVFPGRRMPGRMGNDRVTLKNVLVVGVNPEKHELMLKGAIPGARGGILEISKIKS